MGYTLYCNHFAVISKQVWISEEIAGNKQVLSLRVLEMSARY